MTDPIEARLEELVNLPVDHYGLSKSYNDMVEIFRSITGSPEYDKLLQFAYRRVIRVFETDENAVPLFYRADYMLCLLGNVTEGIAKVPEEIAAKIKQAYFAMKERHNCTRSLPCEEDLDRWL